MIAVLSVYGTFFFLTKIPELLNKQNLKVHVIGSEFIFLNDYEKNKEFFGP